MDNKTRTLLEKCATQFQYYADIHAAKDTYEGNLKADVNRRFVKEIREHLDGTP